MSSLNSRDGYIHMKYTYHVHVPMRRVSRWWRVVWRHVVTWLVSSTIDIMNIIVAGTQKQWRQYRYRVRLSASPVTGPVYERTDISALLFAGNRRASPISTERKKNDVIRMTSLGRRTSGTVGTVGPADNRLQLRPIWNSTAHLLSGGQNSWSSGALITKKWQRVASVCYFSCC